MADIILSIHGRHASAILAGTKTVELRRRVPAKTPGRVVIYQTSPTKRLVGEFTVPTIIDAPPSTLWTMVGHRACVTREEFAKYFGPRKGKPCDVGYGLEVGTVTRYQTPVDPRSIDRYWSSPQSFCMLTPAMSAAIDKRDEPRWLSLDELIPLFDCPPGLTKAAAASVPVGPEHLRAEVIDGERIVLYSPAAVSLMRAAVKLG